MKYLRCAALSLALVLLSIGCQPAQPAPTAAGAKPVAPEPKPAASPAAKPVAPDWQLEWNRTLAAAKTEGRVVVTAGAGEARRKALTEFREAYPDIQLEFTSAPAQQIAPKVLAERRGGQFLLDVCVCSVSSGLEEFVPGEAVDPLKPHLIRPEVWEDSKWRGGFDAGFMDTARQRVYATVAYLNWQAFINRDIIPESEITKLEDLLDPKYKGRIVWEDPRDGTTGAYFAAMVKDRLGVDKLKYLLTQQDAVFIADKRQLAEFVVRGRYPIGIGSDIELAVFRQEGLGLNVRNLDLTEATTMTMFQGVMMVNKAPHPNAAKVYLDWFLSKEGQGPWNKNLPYNSRRLDIEPGDPATLPKPSVKYFTLDPEENLHLRVEVVNIAKEVLR